MRLRCARSVGNRTQSACFPNREKRPLRQTCFTCPRCASHTAPHPAPDARTPSRLFCLASIVRVVWTVAARKLEPTPRTGQPSAMGVALLHNWSLALRQRPEIAWKRSSISACYFIYRISCMPCIVTWLIILQVKASFLMRTEPWRWSSSSRISLRSYA